MALLAQQVEGVVALLSKNSDVSSEDVETKATLTRSRGYLPWFAQDSVNQFASSAWTFFVPLLIVALSGSPWVAGALLGMGTLIATVVGIFGGALVDRMNRRTALLLYSGLQSVTWAVTALLALLGVLNLLILAIAIITVSIVSGLFRGASNALLRSIVAPRLLPKAFANNQARDSVIELGSAPAIGFLFGLAPVLAFACVTVSNFVGVLTSAAIPKRSGEVVSSGLTFVQDLWAGFRWLYHHRPLVVSTVIVSLGNFALTAVFTTVQLFYFEAGESATTIGFVYTGAAVGMFVGSLLASSLITRIPVGRVLIVALLVVTAATLSLVTLPHSVGLSIIPMTLIGFILPFVNSGIGGWVYSQIPQGLQGRVGGVSRLLFGFATALAPAAAGLALAVASFDVAVLVGALAFLLALLLALASPTIRRIGTPTNWVVQTERGTPEGD